MSMEILEQPERDTKEGEYSLCYKNGAFRKMKNCGNMNAYSRRIYLFARGRLLHGNLLAVDDVYACRQVVQRRHLMPNQHPHRIVNIERLTACQYLLNT